MRIFKKKIKKIVPDKKNYFPLLVEWAKPKEVWMITNENELSMLRLVISEQELNIKIPENAKKANFETP